MKNPELKTSIGIFACFLAFEFFLRMIIKAIFGGYLSTIGTTQVILSIIFNIVILVLGLKLSTVLVYKNNKNVFDKSKVIKYIVLFNFVLSVFLAFYYTFSYKKDYESYEKDRIEIENYDYSKQPKKTVELLKKLNKTRENITDELNRRTNQNVIISIAYILSRFLVMFLLSWFLKQNINETQVYNNLTEDQILAMKNSTTDKPINNTLNNSSDNEKNTEFKTGNSNLNNNTISQEDADERARKYDFLFEEKKLNRSIKGVDIAITVLGAISIFLAFASPILGIICSAIGLLIGNINIGTNSPTISKTGYMFCKIAIVLAPSIMIISFVLSILGVVTALSAVTGIFTLFMH